MNEPLVSSDALGLHRDALVWDMTLPIITPGSPQRKQPLLRRAAAAGFDYISITLAVDLYDFRAAATELARHRSLVADHSDVAVLADSTAAISEATPRRLVDHIDHVAGLVGPEHVGLGLDYV